MSSVTVRSCLSMKLSQRCRQQRTVMRMDELKPLLHVVSFSGGKDSTAMLLKMLEMGMQVDVVLFCDTGLEFPALYDHVHKVEQDTGMKVTTVKSEYTFEYLMLHKPIKRKKPELRGKTGYSWAGPLMRWCTNLLKTVPREKFLSELRKKYTVIEYIGIAADETERITHKCNCRPNVRLPLVEWGMTEADCLQYCRERGYDWGGLYEKFGRVSCWCCPLQPLNELRVLYYDFPDLWKQLREWDDATWRTFKPGWSVRKLEARFDFELEWQTDGNQLGTKEFRKALKKRLEGVDG